MDFISSSQKTLCATHRITASYLSPWGSSLYISISALSGLGILVSGSVGVSGKTGLSGNSGKISLSGAVWFSKYNHLPFEL